MEEHNYRVIHHAMLNAFKVHVRKVKKKTHKCDNLRFPCDIPNEADKGNNNKTHPENGTAEYNVLKMINKRRL